jgi:hypothetical protein
MAIRSTPLGPVTVSGDEAKALTHKLAYGRGTRAAMAAAKNGQQLVRNFDMRGSVVIEVKPVRESKRPASAVRSHP